MRLDVIRAYGASNEWCVTVDGVYVVGFAGPDAQHRALRHREELEGLLTVPDEPAASAPVDVGDAGGRGAAIPPR